MPNPMEIVLQCKKCGQKNLFNHPLEWKDEFRKHFGEYKLTYRTTLFKFSYKRSKKSFPLGEYTCGSCKK